MYYTEEGIIMALLSCPECGGSVSSQATVCPHCGCPISGISSRPTSYSSDNRPTIKCPKCGSRNVSVSIHGVGSYTHGRSEWRSKSPLTRAGNAAGRAAMILSTGGLWALTPKRSKYSKKMNSKSHTDNRTFAVCQSCGNSWRVGEPTADEFSSKEGIFLALAVFAFILILFLRITF